MKWYTLESSHIGGSEHEHDSEVDGMNSQQERYTLERVITWGELPTTDTDVERLERDHERALAAAPEDDGAGARS